MGKYKLILLVDILTAFIILDRSLPLKFIVFA